MCRLRGDCVIVALALLLAAPGSGSTAEEPTVRKYALVVGANQYDHANFRNLDFAENDAQSVADVLAAGGWQVRSLVGNRATLDEVKAALRLVVEKRHRNDVVLVGLAGHGLYFPDDNGSYFCPRDAAPHDPRTMLALTDVYKELAQCGAGAKLLLVDACREESVRGTPKKRGIDTALQAPEGVGVLFSCSPGQFAFESAEYKHGVFFHHVLEGLRGKAKDAESGEVTWDLLRAYVKKQVSRDVARLFPRGKQVPHSVESLAEVPPLLVTSNRSPLPMPAAGWSGKWVLIKRPDVRIRKNVGDDAFTTASTVHYHVVRDQGDWLKVEDFGDGEWLSKTDAVVLDEAVGYFNGQIEKSPKDDRAYAMRATAWRLNGDLVRAVRDLSEAIRLNPDQPSWRQHRALVYEKQNEFAEAIDDYCHALRMVEEKNSAAAAVIAYQIAVLLQQTRQYKAASLSFDDALRHNADLLEACNRHAWLLATCPVAAVRDGNKAVALARKACARSDWKNPASIDTLAAAYAEAGEFEQAVRYQTMALELAGSDADDSFRQRLRLYRERRPYRESE